MPVQRQEDHLVTNTAEPVDYSKNITPSSYRCGNCGATGCKLWREYNTFLSHQHLYCCDCAAADQKKDVSDIDEEGRRSDGTGGGRTDQIGWLIPAVPTEENDTFWGYTAVPKPGCIWWRKLPTRAAKTG